MAIKSGNIIHDVYGVVIDRLQSAGGSIDVPSTKIKELGNYESVEVVRDIPDLQFNMESWDVSTEIEALICGKDSTTVSPGAVFDFRAAKEMGVMSPIKTGTSFDVDYGAILPWLTLESANYSFGLTDSASQTFNFRGDSIYYVPGSPRYEEFTIVDEGPYTLANDPAIKFSQSGAAVYVVSAVLVNTTTGDQKRLKFGDDYANTTSTITLAVDPVASYDLLRVWYGSADTASYPQSVHQGTGVKPGGVRGRDIDIYIGNPTATVYTRWTDVQSYSADWSVSLESDEEFGNTERVSYGYSDTPEVTGTVGIKPRSPQDLWGKLGQISGVTPGEIVGAQATTTLPLRAVIRKPNTSVVLKTIDVPKARFKIPSFDPSVDQKLETSLEFESDDGVLLVYAGSPA